MTARFWTDYEKRQLLELAAEGLGRWEIARRMNRSPNAVAGQARKMRLSLRQRDENGTLSKHGVILGSPGPGTPVPGWYPTHPAITAHRETILSGEIDATAVEQRIRSEVAGLKAERLCVSCGSRPVVHTRHRLCAECHVDRLEEVGSEPESAATEWRRTLRMISYHERRLEQLLDLLSQLEPPRTYKRREPAHALQLLERVAGATRGGG